MRPSTFFIVFMITALLLSGVCLGHVQVRKVRDHEVLIRNAALVRALQLTDLALFTEARYTRHPSMADGHAAFQNHPAALEHFPSGSLVAPPAAWRKNP